MKQNNIFLEERTVYFDYLRVFATFSVMILHISATNWYYTDVNGFEWQIFNFYDSIVRWCVPVFVMISGALFLNRKVSLKKIYTKYILRMIISYIIWSMIYALFANVDATDRLLMFLTGHYHMWFIFMIIGMYMCIPFIRPIVEDDNIIRYFLILAFLFVFIIPEIKMLAKDFGNEVLVASANIIEKHTNNMSMNIVLGYTSYFILGYYLNKITMTKQQQMCIYAVGAIGFFATIVLDLIVALKTQKYCSNYYSYFSVNVFFEAVAVFTWFKYKKYNRERINFFVKKLSKYSFGAYLVHALVIEQLDIRWGLNTLSFNALVSVICIGVVVFAISYIISYLLNQIPIVRKYMV